MDLVISFFQDIINQLNDPWKIFGIAAQSFFMMRFVVQWFASERAGKSVMPVAFWYFSLLGAMSLLVYGIREREIVIIMGQSFPMVIYLRNLRLIYKHKKNKLNNALDTTPISSEPIDTEETKKKNQATNSYVQKQSKKSLVIS